MKILHIISGDLWAGAEVQAFTLLTALKNTHRVQVAAALMNEGELAKRLRAQNIPVTVFPETEMDALSTFFALRRLIKQWQPDVVHTHRFKENILGALASACTRSVPSFRTAHGAPEHPARGLRKLPKRLLAALDRWLGATVQKGIVAVSDDLAKKLAEEFPSEKIHTIPNGIDVDDVRARIAPVDFRLHKPDALHIGIVGRLTAVKRVDLFLDTCKKLYTQQPNTQWRFHIFGDGPLLEQLTRQADQLGIADRTLFHGHRNDIAACIAGLDVLVMCSDHEGLPMTILEAVAIGSRIVAHAVGGIPDVLDDYPQGLLVQQHDSKNYAEAIAKLLQRQPVSTPEKLLHRISAESNAEKVLRCYERFAANSAVKIART